MRELPCGEGDLNPRAQSALDPCGRDFVLSNPAPYQARRSPQAAPIKARAINAFGAAAAHSFGTRGSSSNNSSSSRDTRARKVVATQHYYAGCPPALGKPVSPNQIQRRHQRLGQRHWIDDGLFANMTLILVSNRLPVTVRRIGNRLDVQPNPGGVAAGLASFLRELQGRWVGWPGAIPPRATQEVTA